MTNLLRQLPHNIDAEMAVLGGLLMNNRIAARIQWLHEEHFVLSDHRTVYRAIVETIGKGRIADPVTMKELFQTDESLGQAGGVEYLHSLASCAAVPINAVEYARLIVDLYIRRELIAAGEHITNNNYIINGTTAPQNLGEALGQLECLRRIVPAPETVCLDLIATIATKEFPIVKELVPGLVCPGLTLLCAKPKVGKSFMLLEFGLALAEGGIALGQLRCLKHHCILIMLEDSQRRIAGRAKMLRPDGIAEGCWLATDWPKGNAGIARLDATLDQYPDVQMVGIDVLAAFRDPAKDGGGYQSDYESVQGLQKLAQRRHIAIVLLHHLRKADGDDPIDLVSGTLGITAAADHVIVVTGNVEAGYKLTMRGRDIPEVQWDMTFVGGQWTVVGDSMPKRKRTDMVDAIDRDNQVRDMLAQGKKQRDIAKVLGISTATVNRIVAKLANNGSHAPDA